LKKRLLNIAVALGLVSGLFVGAIAPAGASGPEFPGESRIYFPWVPNNDTIAGIEGITGSVTIQNVEAYPVDVTLTDAAGNELTSITLNPRASQTFEADDLGIEEPGSGVIASADWADLGELIDAQVCLEGTVDFTRGAEAGTVDSQALTDAPAAIDAVQVTQGGFTFPASSYNWQYNASTGELAIDWSPSGPEPAEGKTYTVTYVYECPAPRIAGVEKHTVGTVGARTTSATEAVDGYSAVPLFDLALASDEAWSIPQAGLENQSRWVLPIVQTNNGWNTEFFITNVSGMNNSVNVTFYRAGGQGYAGEGEMILSGKTLASGETVRVNLLDYGFDEGVVGSLWIDATHAVVATAFRHKVETGMMLTTNAQPRHDQILGENTFDPTVKFGPLVFRDYNGWNTGINIANLSGETNKVTVTYYNYAGNAVATERVTIPPRAMEYVYTPATGNFGLGDSQITAVRIDGDYPLVAAIDEVKYLGGQGEGHAMSYPASFAIKSGAVDEPEQPFDEWGRFDYENLLALPLVQKGNPTTGVGDTSGINLFNPSQWETKAYIQFVDQSGVPVAPTVANTDAEDPIELTLQGGAGATVYTLNYSEMPAGFQGAAIVGVGYGTSGSALVAVSNNVNYAVDGDGSAVFNLSIGGYEPYLFLDS